MRGGAERVFNFGKQRVDDGYLKWIVKEFPKSNLWWKAAASVTSREKPQEPVKKNVGDLLSELKHCTKKRDLRKGKDLHINAVKAGIQSNIYVQAALINLYAKCGSMEDARALFDSILDPDGVCWNVLIMGYTDNGQGSVALDMFTRMNEEGRCAPDSITYVAALKACTLLAAGGGEAGKRECLERSRQIHKEIGHHRNHHVRNTLINLYAKCGIMEDARTLFDSICDPDVVSWTAVILGYADNGQGSLALEFFTKMKKEGKCLPNSVTYVAALKACTLLAADGSESGKRECLQRARHIHSEIGCHMNGHAQTTLIKLYAKCGSMEDARLLFDGIQDPDVVCWNCLLMGYADNGQGSVALDMFIRMKKQGKAPDSVTYVAVLKACILFGADGSESGRRECLQRGRELHSEIGRHMDHHVRNTLINLYAKCGSMEDARAVFDSVENPDVVSWTSLILGYADNGKGSVALNMFNRMKKESKCSPNSITYVAALKACTLLAADGNEAKCLERGKQIHSEIGCHMDRHAGNTLINLYAKCGVMEDARTCFDSICDPDVVSWTALIVGYVENGQGSVALDMFTRMKEEGRCAPDSVTHVAALKACTLLAADGSEAGKRVCLERGRRIHKKIGHQMDQHVRNTLINLYAKCGSMEDARPLFDSIRDPDVVSWTALVLGYADNGQGSVALDMFARMKKEGKCVPNSVTYVAALKACTMLAADGSEAGKRVCLETGRQIHSEIGHLRNDHVLSTLINLYAKCGSMEVARPLFDSICDPNVVCWNVLILGYVENGQCSVALDMFTRMKKESNCALDSVTYVAALKACSLIGALDIGRRIHSAIREFDSHVVTSLVNFYAKCAHMEEAREVFDFHPQVRTVGTWTALLAGYAFIGDTGSVFDIFEAMKDQGFQPDAVTFLCILSCCSHAGLIEKGWEFIESMATRYGVTPDLMHYNCMIDLLGRANKLDEAVALLEKMPFDPNTVTFNALLGACRIHGRVEHAEYSAARSMELDPTSAAPYGLLLNIYTAAGLKEEVKIKMSNEESLIVRS